MKLKSPNSRRKTGKRTELRRASQQAARRLEREATEREWRLFLTAKFDRAWKAAVRLHAQVGTTRFREMMVELRQRRGACGG